MLNTDDIRRILPHRYPFLMVDKVLEIKLDERIIGIKNVTINEPYFVGHFPERPVMPGVLIVETLAQVGAILYILSLKSEGNAQIYFMGIDKFKFRKPVVPGDQLRLEVDVTHRRSRGWRMDGRAYVGDKLVAEGKLTALINITKGGQDAKK